MTQARTAAPHPQTDACHATIVICTYNRLATLPRTLHALERLRGRYSFEVIVVNGPSDDGTTEYLDSCDSVRVLPNPQINLSVSRNIGIANAAGKYVAFIDDDAVPEPDWLCVVLDRMEAEPELSAAGGFIRDANGISFQDKYVFCDIFGNGHPCDNPDYATFLRREKRLYPSLTGTNVIFRRADLLAIGGFDELFAYFRDETDVNKRMNDAGMTSLVIPEAEIHHKYAPSHLRTADRTSRNMYPIARSVAYFAVRHALPELGWQAVSGRLQEFYRSEFMWKRESLTSGRISKQEFETLMLQVRQGIIDGIDRHFDPVPPGAGIEERIDRHRVDTPPVIRRMRDADEMLRLCMFSQDHGRDGQGGIGHWTNLVARGLAARGHEVTLIGDLPERAPHEYCDFTSDGVWSHNIGHFEREAGNETDSLGLPKTLANASKRKLTELRRIMPRRRFQVASTPIWDVEGAAVIGAGELPTVLSLHTCAGLMLESKPEWRSNEQFYYNHVLRVINAEIQALRRCSLILANSETIMRDISELYGLDLFARPHAVVPHGVDDIAQPDGLLETRLAARESAAPPPLRILFLGRLETRKGVKPMAETIDALLAAGHSIAVDIVGERLDERNFAWVRDLMTKYPESITWHGYLGADALDGLMRRADIFFAPSLYESFGLIYVEAMRYSVPSVAFAVGGVPEVVSDGEDGLLAPPGDGKALHDALVRLITDDALRTALSRAARRSFEAKFNDALMAERLEAVYWQVAQQEAKAARA